MAPAAGTAEAIGPASPLQSCLTFRFDAIQPLELRQGEAFMELDAATRHDFTGVYVLAHVTSTPLAERAG